VPRDVNTAGERRALGQSMRWYDGFVVCLSTSGLLLATLGFSIGALGALGALLLWFISIGIGALQTKIFTEPAAMFPESSGGLVAYSREAWRRRMNLLSPLGGFAYWIGYTAILASFGLLGGSLIQAQWFPDATWALNLVVLHVGLPQLIAAAMIIAVWFVNVAGMNITKNFGYLTGFVVCVVIALFVVLPLATGHFHPHNLTWNIGEKGQAWGGVKLVLVYLYLMGWSAYASEQAATFAPEYADIQKDTQKGLMSSAGFAVTTYVLITLCLGGVLSNKAVAANPAAFYVPAFHTMIGSFGASLVVVLLVITCLLTMNAATMSGSRALYASSTHGYTLRIFGKLNRHSVPAHAMSLDMVVNVIIVLCLKSILAVLAASNMGYFVIIILATAGVAMMRVDLPDQERPIRLAKPWLIVAVLLAAFNFVLLCIGSVSVKLTGYGNMSSFYIGLAALAMGLVFYLWRVYVEDRGSKILWRDHRPYVREREESLHMPQPVAIPEPVA
jgi:amino acid transporter